MSDPNQPSMYSRIDQGLNNFFEPINNVLEQVVGKPDLRRDLLMLLNTIRPGVGAGGLGVLGAAPRPMPPPQPSQVPTSNDLILRMLQDRANPMGVLHSTRMQKAKEAPLRAHTFDPGVELSPVTQSVDAARGQSGIPGGGVLTPANRTPTQEYNLSLIRQLQQGGQ